MNMDLFADYVAGAFCILCPRLLPQFRTKHTDRYVPISKLASLRFYFICNDEFQHHALSSRSPFPSPMVTATAAGSASYDGRTTPRVGGPNRHPRQRLRLVLHALDGNLVSGLHDLVVVGQECRWRKQHALRAGHP